MYLLHKTFHPVNCTFAGRGTKNRWKVGKASLSVNARGTADDIYHLEISNNSIWQPVDSSSRLNPLKDASPQCRGKQSRLEVLQDGGFRLIAGAGREVIRTLPGAGFGLSGKAWLFQLLQQPKMYFYGMGEKCTPFEKSGRIHRFWNTDAFADFNFRQVCDDHYDPDYISVPYIIIKQGNEYAGILIDDPHGSTISTDSRKNIANRKGSPGRISPFFLGAEDGRPSLYIIYGPSLSELTRKFHRLTGVLPLPPLWGLGHHQCRWGYRGTKDLNELADNFEKHDFPVDGLWLDIDYMTGYRVFTFNKEHLPNPQKDLAGLLKRGYRVVPIIDPGVKHETGYKVYDSGHKADIFCKNSGGTEFIGTVWPGFTAFPDFSLESCRRWWSDLMAGFVKAGVGGVWLDMNDPSTGRIECTGMLFRNGKADHGAYHNQYASYMSIASRDGFLKARPNERPFLISRSGYTGQQKYCGNWTGDNCSNWFHLKHTIGKTLNLAMSGMVLNGPDVGGFMGDTNEKLIVDWMKACFLFPFSRNHTCAGTRRQEPWAFSARALRILRQYVRLRYKLLPYFYNLFAEHEQTGEAVLRPLFYDFADSAKIDLAGADDQFMVGPSIMQAPFLTEKDSARTVLLPRGLWLEAESGKWLAGDRQIKVRRNEQTTPIFFRAGSLVAMQRGIRKDNRNNLRDIELYCFLPKAGRSTGRTIYRADDGLSFDYRKGSRTTCRIAASAQAGKLVIRVETIENGFGPVNITPVTVEPFASCILIVDGKEKQLRRKVITQDTFGSRRRFYHWR